MLTSFVQEVWQFHLYRNFLVEKIEEYVEKQNDNQQECLKKGDKEELQLNCGQVEKNAVVYFYAGKIALF